MALNPENVINNPVIAANPDNLNKCLSEAQDRTHSTHSKLKNEATTSIEKPITPEPKSIPFSKGIAEGNQNSFHADGTHKYPCLSKIDDLDLHLDRLDINNIHDGVLPDFLKKEAETDLHEKQEWINRDVEALREMVLAEPGLLSRTDKLFLLSFLRARKFDYEKAMQMIRGYYGSHRENRELYFDLIPSSLSHIWSLKMQNVLSKPDYKGRTVLLFFIGAWNPDEMANIDDIFRAQVLILEHIVRLPITQLRGVAAIVDCKGLSLNQIYYLTPSYVRRMVSIIQEVFPLRFKALHFVHEPSIFDWAFSIVRPFLSDTIKGRLHFHGENVDELLVHFPQDILPEELGGSAGPVDNTYLVERLHQNEDYFRDHFSYGYLADEVGEEATESAPPNSVFTAVAGMGSFLGSYYRRMCFE